ncbi:unnamed protein product [Dibothriocephalus latus]|uniref:Uncharacterized protein n=1 Tax=Dibothriocephalus latus TaxID=60516 RepID=A0A3P6QJZ3_DIBLA|nr:unnamed protein product [Dibothriocephalus latus]
MYRLNLHNRKWILLLAILAGLRILSEVFFSSQWMLHLVEIDATEVSSSRCKLRWINIPEPTPDGVYDLSFRYCVDLIIRVTRHTTFPLDQISNNGGEGNVRFEEMTQLNDADWKRPINPGVYLLYPQGIALREVITNYRETGLVPEVSKCLLSKLIAA